MTGRAQVIRTVAGTVAATVIVNVVLYALFVGTVNPLGTLWGDRFPRATLTTRHTKTKLFAAWQREAPVEGLIVGASRSLVLPPRAFSEATGFRFFNYALAAGTLEDIPVVLKIMDERHVSLRELVLGVDVQMLTRYAPAHELLTDWEFAPRYERKSPSAAWKIRHAAALARETLTPLFVKAVGTSIMAAVTHKEPLYRFHEDGLVDYASRERIVAAGKYPREAMIKKCTSVVLDSLLVQYPYDPRRIAMLDSILARARAEHIRVTMWLTPDHPDLVAGVARHPGLDAWVRGIPDSLGRIAATYGASFVNLHTIDTFGGDPNDYYDCAHFGRKNAAKVTERLLALEKRSGLLTLGSGR